MGPSDAIAKRVRELRRQRDWTAKDLAAKCAGLGAAELTAAAILNIETGRRDANGVRRRNITVEELLVLASALMVTPMALLFSESRTESDDLLADAKHAALSELEDAFRRGWDECREFVAGEAARCRSEYVIRYSNSLPWPK